MPLRLTACFGAALILLLLAAAGQGAPPVAGHWHSVLAAGDIAEPVFDNAIASFSQWLMSRGVGQSWEWLTDVTPFESWRYDAVGKPLWSRATGWTRLTDLGDGRTRVTFIEEYEAFNPIMRVLLEKTVHRRLSRDNDTILAALEGGLRWHRKRRARTADTTEHAAEN